MQIYVIGPQGVKKFLGQLYASNADSGSGDVKHLPLIVFVKCHGERTFQQE